MLQHSILGDPANPPEALRFSPVFNVCVPFIDRHLAEGRAQKVALLGPAGPVSYGQLADRVTRCGNFLLGLGLQPGDRLLMTVLDSPEFLYLFWGAIRAGILPVPLNTLLRTADYRFLIEDSGCKGFALSPELAGEVDPALDTASLRVPFRIPTEGLLERLMDCSNQLEPARTAPEDDCFWLYSSGSTGKPKGAIHRHRSLAFTSQKYGVQTLGIRQDDVFYSAAKLFFAYGLGNAMSFPLWVGATTVLSPQRPSPALTWQNIERYRPTLYFGVPTLYAALLQFLTTEDPDLSSLRLCVSAGEALPAGLFQRWKQRTGLTILDGIGSTEALHMFLANRESSVRPGTSGQPVDGYQVQILDEAGHPVTQGQPGRLRIRGLSTARAYWNNPQRSADTFGNDGWLDTGDTYSQDADGWFVYSGRSDDMLKVSGQWCSPFELESALQAHPAILEAAVVGRMDQDGLIKPEAHIVLKSQLTAPEGLREDLFQHCRAALAHFKVPRWFQFVPELPKTATGKIQRFRLRTSPTEAEP